MMHELRDEEIDPETIPDEWLVERMRNLRNELLAGCDWTQVNDAPVDQTLWGTYRQALRDFPATWKPADTVTFPDPPS